MRIADFGRDLIKDDKGSVIIETSLGIVIIMLVFLSGIYFMSAYRTKIVMEMAVKEGARQYQVSHDISVATNELRIGNVKGVTIKANGSRVTASKNIQINVPIIGDYLFNLKTSAEFRKENKILYYQLNDENEDENEDAQQGSYH